MHAQKKPVSRSRNTISKQRGNRKKQRNVFASFLTSRKGQMLSMLVFVVVFGFIGYMLLIRSSAATYALSVEQCKLRGRVYTSSTGACESWCQSGAGAYTNSAVYNYCSGAISTSIDATKCGSLGRKYVSGNGCSRRWQQTNATGALQCVNSAHTYIVASYDYCSTSTSGGTSSGGTASTSSAGWVWPLYPSRGISQKYGKYNADRGGTHKGIDIPAPQGTTVVSAHAGKVVRSYYSSGCGYFVLIKAEGTSYWHGYQHLASDRIAVGTYVSAGQRIGRLAGTNPPCINGTHLHFSIETGEWISYYRSDAWRSTDPLPILPKL